MSDATPGHAVERTGTARSGDVDVFFRQYGSGGRTPVLVLHQANYYDSKDWAPVAARFAGEREAVAIDARGFGRSGWSANKDYSHAANTADALAVLEELGWESAVLVGAARGAAHAVLAASRVPDRVAAVVMVDYVPAIGIGHPGVPLLMTQMINREPPVFPSFEAALGATTREQDAPEGSAARARFEEVLKEVPGGYTIGPRDPDFINPIPLTPGDWPFEVPIDVDLWAELAAVRCPVLNVRVTRPAAPYPPESIERIAQEFPDVEVTEIDSSQDASAAAPGELVAAVEAFLAGHDL